MELQVRLGRAGGSAAHREAVTGHVLMIRSFEAEGVEGEICSFFPLFFLIFEMYLPSSLDKKKSKIRRKSGRQFGKLVGSWVNADVKNDP